MLWLRSRLDYSLRPRLFNPPYKCREGVTHVIIVTCHHPLASSPGSPPRESVLRVVTSQLAIMHPRGGGPGDEANHPLLCCIDASLFLYFLALPSLHALYENCFYT